MTMHKSFTNGFLVGITCLLIPSVLYYNQKVRDLRSELQDAKTKVVESKYDMGVYITASHLPQAEKYGELLYEDETRDISYYRKPSDRLTMVELDEVNIDGLEGCKIVKAEPGVFYVSTTTPDRIVNGMSGTRVCLKTGEAIGFVDALVANRQLKCITLE